jgi:hypothetical protein
MYFECRYAKSRIFILMLSLLVASVVILSVVSAGLDVFSAVSSCNVLVLKTRHPILRLKK